MNFFKPMVLIGALISSGAWADSPTQTAVWQTQEVTFRYNAFTSPYSCVGLRDKLRQILLALGARKEDLKLRYGLCGPDTSQPYQTLSLQIELATLQPATADSTAPIVAHWRHVDVGDAVRYERGDCELAEQVRQSLLPLFTTRKVEARDGGCAPRSTPTGKPVLKLEVLMPDAK